MRGISVKLTRRMPLVILLTAVVLPLLLVARCGKREEIVRTAIAAYSARLADGYRALNMNGLASVATPEQAQRAYHHMAALGEGMVAMDSELLSRDYQGITWPATDRAEAVAHESWQYRYTDLQNGKPGDYHPVNYTVRYSLLEQEGCLLVQRVEVLATDRTLGDDQLPFFQRPASAVKKGITGREGKKP